MMNSTETPTALELTEERAVRAELRARIAEASVARLRSSELAMALLHCKLLHSNDEEGE